MKQVEEHFHEGGSLSLKSEVGERPFVAQATSMEQAEAVA